MHIAALFLLFLISYAQCQNLWSADLPQVSGQVLEKGKPLQLPKSYAGVQIADLKGTLYSDSLSQLHGVKELRITSHELTTIEKGALCSAPDMKTLQIDFYGSKKTVSSLTKEMFENCNNLEELILIFDGEKHVLITIDNDAFEDLVNLKTLALQSYVINHLSKDFLKISSTLLTDLALSSAEITEIDSNVFEDFTNLEVLSLHFNRNWTYLPQDLFRNLPKLKSISLRENGLKDLTWDEFKGLEKVKSLDVGSNQISSFDAKKIAKNLPNLERLSIELNPLPCKQMEKFAEDLKKRLNHPVEVEYKFDPGFFDPCEEEV